MTTKVNSNAAVAIAAAETLRPNPDVLWQRLDDQVILMHLKTDRIYSLNSTGARFWELIAGGMGLAAVRRELGEEFDVRPEVLAAEVESILALMIGEQLLIAVEP
jgi:8-oxo-dGTP pyrophosphatase MutT (NUDIX family)